MIKLFHDWCNHNKIRLTPNIELFFINERLVIKPDYIIGNNMYLDIIKPSEITDEYLNGCIQFSKSNGTIVVIPSDIIKDLHTITKEDIQNKFGIIL